MSGIVTACPWCRGKSITWSIPPFSSQGQPECEDCGAQGPHFHDSNRADRAGIDVQAIRAWNGSRTA